MGEKKDFVAHTPSLNSMVKQPRFHQFKHEILFGQFNHCQGVV